MQNENGYTIYSVQQFWDRKKWHRASFPPHFDENKEIVCFVCVELWIRRCMKGETGLRFMAFILQE